MKKNIFAPPTKEELGENDLFAPPSQEEIGVQEERPLVTGKGLLKSTLESLPMAGSLVGGALGTVGAPGLGTIAGAGLGAGAGKALENLGERYLLDEEKTRPEIYGETVKATQEGLLSEIGGQALPSVVKGIKEGGSKALSKISDTQAFKSTGAMLRDFRSASDKGLIGNLGKFIKEKGIAPLGASFETVAKNANELRQSAGSKLDDIYSSVKEAIPDFQARKTGFNPVRDSADIISAAKSSLKNKEGAGRAVGRLEQYLNELAAEYGDNVLDPRTANDVKTAMDEVVNYSRSGLTKEPVVEKAFYAARKNLEKRIAADVDLLGSKIGREDLSKALREANKEYGYSSTIGNIAKDRSSRESSKELFGLTDTIAGGALGTIGAMTGSTPEAIAYGLLGIAANKGAKKFGPGLLSRGADVGAKALSKIPTGNTSMQLLRASPKGLIGGE